MPEVIFTGPAGRLEGRYHPAKQKNAPIAMVLHPHPQFRGSMNHPIVYQVYYAFVARGFSVAALDCRGQGGKSEDVGGVKGNTLRGHIIRGLDDAPEKLHYRSVFLDTAQLANVVMNFPEVDADRVGAQGGSQGGALTLACVSLEPRVKRAAPVYPFLSDYQRVWEMDLAKDAYDELKTYFRLFDPRHERHAEVFERLGYIDIQHLAPRIRAEVMMGVGQIDTGCPPGLARSDGQDATAAASDAHEARIDLFSAVVSPLSANTSRGCA